MPRIVHDAVSCVVPIRWVRQLYTLGDVDAYFLKSVQSASVAQDIHNDGTL